MGSPDIQDNLLGYPKQLSLKKYCCKTALYGHSPRFSLSGTWPSSTTSVGLGSVLTPSGRSSAIYLALGKRSRSLLSIILTQWGSKHWSFWPFYKGERRLPWFLALRWSTKPIWMKPTLNIPYYIVLPESIVLFLTGVTFIYWKLYVRVLLH